VHKTIVLAIAAASLAQAFADLAGLTGDEFALYSVLRAAELRKQAAG
jgi:hypothetical protein